MPQVVVTGSASGIGAGIASVLRLDGHEIVGWDIAGPPEGRVDVGDEASVRAATEALAGELDGAVLAAGVSAMAPLLSTTTAEWDRQMRVNAFGVFNCLRALVPKVRHGSCEQAR